MALKVTSLTVGALMAGTLLGTTPAYAQSSAAAPGLVPGLYLGGSLGWALFWDQEPNDVDVEYDYLGYHVAGQVGYRFDRHLRGEAELEYETSSAEVEGSVADLDVSVIRGTASGYYDLDLAGMPLLRPYGGGGIGLAQLSTEFGAADEDEILLTFHGEAGLSYRISDQLEVVPAFRFEYIAEGDDTIDDSTWISLFKAGVRFSL